MLWICIYLVFSVLLAVVLIQDTRIHELRQELNKQKTHEDDAVTEEELNHELEGLMGHTDSSAVDKLIEQSTDRAMVEALIASSKVI